MPQRRTRHSLRHHAPIASSNTTVEKTLRTAALLSRGTSATTNAIAIEIVETIVTIEIANGTPSATAITTTSIGLIVVPHLIATTNLMPIRTTDAVPLKTLEAFSTQNEAAHLIVDSISRTNARRTENSRMIHANTSHKLVNRHSTRASVIAFLLGVVKAAVLNTSVRFA